MKLTDDQIAELVDVRAIDELEDALDPPTMTTRCAHCGKNPAEGLATIDGVRYCHGDWQPSPTCYESAARRSESRLLTDEQVRAIVDRKPRG